MIEQLDIFGPLPCLCGAPAEVWHLPNYPQAGQWAVGHLSRCPRVYAKDRITAVDEWNEMARTFNAA